MSELVPNYFNTDGTAFDFANQKCTPPIKLETDGWYFLDETEDMHGPFGTFEETVELFNKYCEVL